MPHIIKAFIGKKPVVEKLAADWLKDHIRLPQDFSMLFLTEELFEDITELAGMENELENQFECFTSAIASILESHSAQSSLAYIETEYFGGLGGQGAVLYENGQIKIPPTWEEGIINQVLSQMGAEQLNGEDEFDSVNLGNYRRMS